MAARTDGPVQKLLNRCTGLKLVLKTNLISNHLSGGKPEPNYCNSSLVNVAIKQ